MADMITNSTKCLNPDNSPCHWEFSYSVEHDTKANQFCVVVKADEMDDATDADEAKTLANAKASVIKTDWVASLAEATSSVPVIETPEEVTL